MQDLRDKVVFVTGGVSGLGLGIARAFSAAGAKVVITYMREAHRDQALAHFKDAPDRVHALKLDVTDRNAVARAADEAERVFGNVHILVNNAGVNVFGPMDEATYEDWDWILGVNLGGAINGIVTFIPRLKAHGEGGHIVNVASMAALITGPMAGIYTTSKFALRGLSECLRDCLKPHGIGVSVHCPGLVKSNIGEATINRPAHLANSGFKVDAATMKLWNELHSPGMDPLEAGQAVVRGVQRNDAYIFLSPGTPRRHRADLQGPPGRDPRRRGGPGPPRRRRSAARGAGRHSWALIPYVNGNPDRQAGQPKGAGRRAATGYGAPSAQGCAQGRICREKHLRRVVSESVTKRSPAEEGADCGTMKSPGGLSSGAFRPR